MGLFSFLKKAGAKIFKTDSGKPDVDSAQLAADRTKLRIPPL